MIRHIIPILRWENPQFVAQSDSLCCCFPRKATAMRSSLCRILTASAMCMVVVGGPRNASSAESLEELFTPEELETGARRRKAAIDEVAADLKALEQQRQIVARRRDVDRAKMLAGQIRALQAKLRTEKKTTAEDHAAILRQEAREQEAAREEKAKADAIRKVLPPLSELCDGCPLAIHDCQVIKNSTAALVQTFGALEASRMGVHRYEGHPELIVTVVCTSEIPVEAFEVSFEILDSFGNTIVDRRTGSAFFVDSSVPSKPLRKGDIETALNWGSKDYATAFMAKAWVSKVRLSNGTVWEQTYAEAGGRKHGVREADRVDVWQARECRD
jgi:hypothetical protein